MSTDPSRVILFTSAPVIASVKFNNGEIEFVKHRTLELDPGAARANTPQPANAKSSAAILVRITASFVKDDIEKKSVYEFPIERSLPHEIVTAVAALESVTGFAEKNMDHPKTYEAKVQTGLTLCIYVPKPKEFQSLVLVSCAKGDARLIGDFKLLGELRSAAQNVG